MTTTGVLQAATPEPRPLPRAAHFGVVPFRRDASGTIVPGAAMEVPNSDIAWRRARAEAFEHGNVGAVALAGSQSADAGGLGRPVLLARFGDVALDRLAG